MGQGSSLLVGNRTLIPRLRERGYTPPCRGGNVECPTTPHHEGYRISISTLGTTPHHKSRSLFISVLRLYKIVGIGEPPPTPTILRISISVIMYKKIAYPVCPDCGNGATVIKMIDTSGRDRYPYYCETCDKRGKHFAPKFKVPRHILEGPPHIVKPLKMKECERCHEVGSVEEHHWAPRKLFKDADDWPKSFLCRECHAEWHKIMTGDEL